MNEPPGFKTPHEVVTPHGYGIEVRRCLLPGRAIQPWTVWDGEKIHSFERTATAAHATAEDIVRLRGMGRKIG